MSILVCSNPSNGDAAIKQTRFDLPGFENLLRTEGEMKPNGDASFFYRLVVPVSRIKDAMHDADERFGKLPIFELREHSPKYSSKVGIPDWSQHLAIIEVDISNLHHNKYAEFYQTHDKLRIVGDTLKFIYEDTKHEGTPLH